jgi:hypothetical protein
VEDDSAALAETERWFMHRGIPLFIEGYRATEDVYTRMVPFLVLVAVLEVAGAANFDWPWWQNVLAIAGALLLVFAIWAAVRRASGRPIWRLPSSVGTRELAMFVFLPALLPVIFGQQFLSAIVTMLVNASIVVMGGLVVGYGLVPLTRWALSQTFRQIGDVLNLFARALPLLLLFGVTLFTTAELWQVGASLEPVTFWVVVGFLVTIGLMFQLSRLPREVRRLREQLGGSAAVDACAASPLRDAAVELRDQVRAEPMTRAQEWNVLLVLLFSQAVQIALISASVFVFFVVFGLILIRPEVGESWIGGVVPDEITSWTWFGQPIALTEELLRVSGLLAALSGFYFTVYAITDKTYREEFFEEIVDDVRESLAVRNVYLALRNRVATHAVAT